MILTRDKILSAVDIKEAELVKCPEWGGDVYVQVMTAAVREEYEQGISAAQSEGAKQNIRATLCATTVVDDKGARLFTVADVEALGNKSIVPIQRIFDVASRLNGLNDESVEEMEKNSERDQDGNSSSS